MSGDEETMDFEEKLAAFPLPSIPANQGPPFMAFGVLLDFAVQKTYQDFVILTDLLPKKSDLDRKISIAQFAHSARQLFVRLYAILKWARCGAKVDLCTGIVCFLDQQASMFVDTADRLYQMNCDVLQNARLPVFQIPTAVDVLTLGTYPRLPSVIKREFIRTADISQEEEECVLHRLNYVIERRLLPSLLTLPEGMRNFTVNNGMVTFHVAGEFEAQLTLLGQLPRTPWTLLNLRILVSDPRVTDGSDILSSLQLSFLHHLIQSRLNVSKEPIVELYRVIHCFCLSAQLDILCCQAYRLIGDFMSENLSVEEYVSSEKLVLSYWKEQNQGGVASFKVIFWINQDEPFAPLQVTHIPKSELKLPSMDTESGQLSLDNLLTETVLIRVKHRLQQLCDFLRTIKGLTCTFISDMPALSITFLPDSSFTETLDLSMNLFTGKFVCRLPAFGNNVRIFVNRIDHTMRFFTLKSCETLPAFLKTACEQWPVDRRFIIKFHRFENYYIVLTFNDHPDDSAKVNLDFWLVCNETVSNAIRSADADDDDRSKKNVNLLHFDLRRVVSDTKGFHQLCLFSWKIQKKQCVIPELMAAFSMCENAMPFFLLMEEMERTSARYAYHQLFDGTVVLRVLGIDQTYDRNLEKIFGLPKGLAIGLSCDRHRVVWSIGLNTTGSPLGDSSSFGRAVHRKITILSCTVGNESARKCLDDVLSGVRCFNALYEPVKALAGAYKSCLHRLTPLSMLSSYKLTLVYGPMLRYVCHLQWKPIEKMYILSFGVDNSVLNEEYVYFNPHSILCGHLQHWFNAVRDVSALAHLLQASSAALQALTTLPDTIFRVGSEHTSNQMLYLNRMFSILPTGPDTVRLLCKDHLCLEMRFTHLCERIFFLKTFLNLHISEMKAAIEAERKVSTAVHDSLMEMSDVDFSGNTFQANPNSGTGSSTVLENSMRISTQNRLLVNQFDYSVIINLSNSLANDDGHAEPSSRSPPEDWTPCVVPIEIQQNAFIRICSPSGTHPHPEWSHLQKFILSVEVLEKMKEQANNFTVIRPGQLSLKCNQSEMKFFLNESNLSSVMFKFFRDENDACTESDVQFLEKYFLEQISSTYNAAAMYAFVRMLTVCQTIRRDLLSSFLSIMNIQQHAYVESSTAYWIPEMCFLIPSPQLVPTTYLSRATLMPGGLAIVANVVQKKMLFWIKFVRVADPSHCVAFPFLYDGENNSLQVFRGTNQQTAQQSNSTVYPIETCLLRQQQTHSAFSECVVWPCIRDVMHINELIPGRS
ncbi:Mediator of RNA polymerase II transcription subunit 14 [Trichinella spiralis]|uniref:Mediator of RNA polymerase II transcription subunit 14 n=1 Tax=Trichinella spiralis TaxID=6334 RepID=A0A0V1B0N5_TRISP|nr:Mediator of RNA polymerase II transcription subunit 14 [Trichinella spiralis]KRY30083.1 Mediator of RNA polymerase II transcription subunit 14 [Trichinella spiralis]